jgi:hypothetical protein
MDFMPMYEFHKCVERYQGHYKVKHFSCLDQFLCMAFAQLTYRESLRDIETCLRAMNNKLYHMGIRSRISRNTLANANEKRNWQIYGDFAQTLMLIAKDLYAKEDFALKLNETVYALDSTIIKLCLSLFPWAYYQKGHGGIKVHTLLNLRGNIPSFIKITGTHICDHDILDDIFIESGSFYIMDRGYIDLSRLYSVHLASAFFIIRKRRDLLWQRLYSRPVDKSTGLQCDQTIVFTGRHSGNDYPEKLRRIRFFDSENNLLLDFLTNNFLLPALTIAQLYKCRWQVELFFRWIKQHLRIKQFYGTSENAIKTQIWIAISVYLLVAIVKKRLKLELPLNTILQALSVTAFEKIPLVEAFTKSREIKTNGEQLSFKF